MMMMRSPIDGLWYPLAYINGGGLCVRWLRNLFPGATYEELERDGFLTTVPGKGCFVATQNRETRREAVLCQVEEHLSQAVDAARTGAVGLDELTEMLNTLYNEE